MVNKNYCASTHLKPHMSFVSPVSNLHRHTSSEQRRSNQSNMIDWWVPSAPACEMSVLFQFSDFVILSGWRDDWLGWAWTANHRDNCTTAHNINFRIYGSCQIMANQLLVCDSIALVMRHLHIKSPTGQMEGWSWNSADSIKPWHCQWFDDGSAGHYSHLIDIPNLTMRLLSSSNILLLLLFALFARSSPIAKKPKLTIDTQLAAEVSYSLNQENDS